MTDRQTDRRQAVPSGKAPFDALWEPNFPPSWLDFQVSCKAKGSDAQGRGGSSEFSPLKIKRQEMISID